MTEKELRAIFSSNLKRYRKHRKFSQEKLAEKLDISIPFLSDIENSRKWVSPATLVKLADVLGIEPHELFISKQDISPAMTIILDKWSNEIVDAVSMTVQDIKNHYGN